MCGSCSIGSGLCCLLLSDDENLPSAVWVQVIASKNDIRCQIKHAEEFCAASAAQDKGVLAYDDGAHQLLQDTPKVTARVMHDLTAWLLKHLPP